MNGNRWLWFALCVALAGLLLFGGWLVPVHLRAVDALVLQRAGEGSTSLVARGMELERTHHPDAARLLLQAATGEGIEGTNELAAAVAGDFTKKAPFPDGTPDTNSTPVTEWLIRLENRERVLAYLQSNSSPAVRVLMRARDLTNTVLFPASLSSSGQAMDAALSVCGLLLAGNHLSDDMRDAVTARATSAETHPDAAPLEEVLMDLMSLGQRLTWGQLVVFVNQINDPATLTTLAGAARSAGAQWPQLYAAVVLSQKPEAVAKWLTDFSQTGLADLSASLRYGEGGVDELLQRHLRMASSETIQRWSASGPLAPALRVVENCAVQKPWLAMTAKWLAFLSGGFLLAAAWHYAGGGAAGRTISDASLSGSLPANGESEKNDLSARETPFHLAREILFALGFLLVLLLLSEPFLAQEGQKANFAFHLRLPLTSGATTRYISHRKIKTYGH